MARPKSDYADSLVTRLQAAEERALQAERLSEALSSHLRTLMEVTSEGYVALDQEGSIIEWSHGAEAIFGWTRSEVQGRKFTITPPGFSGSQPPGLSEMVERAGTGLTHSQLRAMHRDGHLVPVEAAVWTSSWFGLTLVNALVRRPTGPHSGEDHSMCRVGSIVESSEEAIIGLDLDGIVLTWNRGAEHVYGWAADEIRGHHVAMLVPPERSSELAALLSRARDGNPVSALDAVRMRRDGSLIDVSESITATFDESGRIGGLSIIARDVTEDRRTATALEAALEEARDAETRSRRFLADTAHQLRTPLAGIQACAETLRYDVTGVERERLLADVVSETTRAGRLMASLLQMARLDRGEPLTFAPCNLGQLCRDEAERVRRRGANPKVSVTATFPVDDYPALDANAVAEILGNLLDNARRHARLTVDINLAKVGNSIEITVSDDGPGIAPENAERIFERFLSLDDKGGSGLGLAIARGLARAHGGDLCWNGRAFVLTLPARNWCDEASESGGAEVPQQDSTSRPSDGGGTRQ